MGSDGHSHWAEEGGRREEWGRSWTQGGHVRRDGKSIIAMVLISGWSGLTLAPLRSIFEFCAVRHCFDGLFIAMATSMVA